MALHEGADERADREHPGVPASDVVEHPADELRSHPSPLEAVSISVCSTVTMPGWEW
jgi:hypothetical protein